MKYISTIVILLLFVLPAFSQDMTKFNLYKPAEDADKEIAAAIKKAKSEHKNVFIQVGGNWCIWCARFNDFVNGDKQLDSIMAKDYVVYHMNYSKENYNAKLLTKYGYPQRFGFPVFIVLDENGKQLHTQNSGYLESGKSYDKEKVFGFFKDWSPSAFNPANYQEK